MVDESPASESTVVCESNVETKEISRDWSAEEA
jgi:hypothetical protein